MLKFDGHKNKILQYVQKSASHIYSENNYFQNIIDFAENSFEKCLYHILFEIFFRKFILVYIAWKSHWGQCVGQGSIPLAALHGYRQTTKEQEV